MEPAAQIAVVETRLPSAASDGRLPSAAVEAIGPTVIAALSASPVATPFFEVAIGEGWDPGIRHAVTAISNHSSVVRRELGAKLRCGGVAADQFPSPEQAAEFIVACTECDLPFKMTAGLHHPIRHHDPALGVMRHGFVNLIAAAALANIGWDHERVLAVISETDPAAFALRAAGLSWRDIRIPVRDLARTRRRFAAYGSCSFSEPVTDLVALGMVAADS
jgi:hypothetical protein